MPSVAWLGMAPSRSSARVLLGLFVAPMLLVIAVSCAADDDASDDGSGDSTVTTVRSGSGGGRAPGTEAAGGEAVSLTGVAIEVHNDPGCGCCTSWAEYLRRHGATVTISEDPQRDAFRAGHGISDEAASCHTAIVGGYAVEGHVPVTAIRRLLDDGPDAAGLALPGMPMDSPGMGGTASDWAQLPMMLVAADGSLSPFEY